MIFQDPATSLNPVYTIGQQLSEIYSVHNRVTKKESREHVIKMLELVKMSEPEKRMDQYPHELSGGMRQRIAIARALLCDPSLLFADEPTTNLDVTIQAQILDLLKELREALGSSLVMITHDMGIVADLTARIQVLYAGRVCEIGPTKEVFLKPKHPYTEALLRAVPHMMISSSERLNVIPGNIPNLVDPPKGCRFHPRCSFAIERCKDKMPDPEEVSSGRYSACIRWKELELEGVKGK
jgi:oligopeptide/dipeptide ABC transporter ATP-binding protein